MDILYGKISPLSQQDGLTLLTKDALHSPSSISVYPQISSLFVLPSLCLQVWDPISCRTTCYCQVPAGLSWGREMKCCWQGGWPMAGTAAWYREMWRPRYMEWDQCQCLVNFLRRVEIVDCPQATVSTCTPLHIPVHMVTKALELVRIYMKKNISGGARQAKRSLDSGCFELISSHQQGIRTACLAHHWFIYTRRTRTLVVQWFQN